MSRFVFALSLAAALALAQLAACAGTPGRAITLPVRLEAAPSRAFTTSTGWRVELELAEITLRALRVLPDDDGARVALLRVLVPVARAHGGHGLDRAVRAEMLGPIRLDALAADPVDLGVARGSAGAARAVDLELGEGDAVARVRGRALRDGDEVTFAGELVVSGGLALQGLPLEAWLDEPGALRLGVRVDRWLDQARFEAIDDGSTAGIALAWSLGVRDARAFTVAWDDEGDSE